MPRAVSPMKATLAGQPPAGPDWLFEIKWDGVRALAFVEDQRVQLVSRNGLRCDAQYPELSVLPQYLGARTAVLDGEIAVLDGQGVSRFELIQQRIGQTDPNTVAHLARSHPVKYFLFDLIYLDGYDLRKVRLAERKETLRAILTETDALRFSEHFAGAGQQMLEAARQQNLEGILAKRASSCYESRRSREWLKIKLVAQQECLICGFTTGEREYFGSLVLGVHEGGKLVWVGNVGTGFDQRSLQDLYTRLKPLVMPRSPFASTPRTGRRVTWVKPELIAQIKFANWTRDGKLRAPVYLGLRHDIQPQEVVRETAGNAPQ